MHFEEFKEIVTGNPDLIENFHRVTHYPKGQFFTCPLDALGYLKEDVFISSTRT